MKKTFPLKIEGKHPERLLEAIKHEIRKYIARERRKPLPKGVDFWDFDCRFGASDAMAEAIHVGAITERINEYAAGGADAFYLEIIAKPGVRSARSQIVSYESGDNATDVHDDSADARSRDSGPCISDRAPGRPGPARMGMGFKTPRSPSSPGPGSAHECHACPRRC